MIHTCHDKLDRRQENWYNRSLAMKNFWQNLPKPFLVQAPMESVTDTVFRQILAKAGKPDVFFTEFTNTDGLLSKGQEEVGKRLKFTQSERPLIAQLWGNDPKKYQESAKMIIGMGFDGIDINMGCPIIKGSCASLIKSTPSQRNYPSNTRISWKSSGQCQNAFGV